MKRLLTAILLLIALIVVMIIFGSSFKSCQSNCSQVTQYDTVWAKGDSFPYKVAGKTPEPIVIIDTVEIPQDIDTMAVLRDYYAKVFYSDTITDGKFKVILNDTISRNRIVSRDALFQDLRGEMIITKTVTLPKRNELYLGGMTLIGDKFTVAPYAMFESKKGFHVMAGSNTKTHILGVGIKLSKPP